MIDINNPTPRTVKTPDGYGELYSADEECVVVKVQTGEKRLLRLYDTNLCDEVQGNDKKD